MVKVFNVEKVKPKENQEILYEGNHGFTKASFMYFENGVGWCWADGKKDCFTYWKPLK